MRHPYQILVLLSIVSFLDAQNLPSPNPECNGMNAAAKQLSKGIQSLLNKNAQCKPNPHCTGVTCSWPGGGFLEVDLHHCKDPVNYHFLLKVPSKHLNKDLTLKQGDEQPLYSYQHKLLGETTVQIKVVKLERTENIVTTTVRLEGCTKGFCRPIGPALIDNQKICVSMKNCSGYNESVHQYKPCGLKLTAGPSTKQPSRFGSASSGHSKTPSIPRQRTSSGPSTKQPSRFGSASSGHSKTPSIPRQRTSSEPSSDGTVDHHKGGKGHQKGGSSGHLSTAAVIGICAAGVFAILVVVGAVVYWKKYHHRSRLRAAYYNDISMHDPLYEDFGPEPEVA